MWADMINLHGRHEHQFSIHIPTIHIYATLAANKKTNIFAMMEFTIAIKIDIVLDWKELSLSVL